MVFGERNIEKWKNGVTKSENCSIIMEVSLFDRNPVQQANLRAKRVNIQCVSCGNTCSSYLCDSCQSILNYKPKTKRVPKLLNFDERELMTKMQLELREATGEDKKDIQCVIDFLVELGREKFKERKINILQSVSDKEYECQECGRPIAHFGLCLSCNKTKKDYRYRAAEKDRDSTERLSRQGIHCQMAVGKVFSQQPNTGNPKEG